MTPSCTPCAALRRRSPVLAAATTLILLAGILLAAAGPADAARARTAMEQRAEARFVALHNDVRQNPAKYGVTDHPPARRMVVAGDIRGVARGWSDQMHRTGQFKHNPNYKTQFCCWRGVAENVVWARQGAHNEDPGNVDRFVDSLWRLWLGSPGHRRNIMNGSWEDFAVGVSFQGGRMYATANFRRRNGTPTAPPPADSAPKRPLAAAPPVVDDTSNPKVRRIHGSDRIRTGVELTLAAFDRADTVVLARADAFPDALAAAPLAGARRAPLLLVGRGAPVDPKVIAALKTLRTKEVIAMGGPGAISDAALAEVRARTGARTQRIHGHDRWATAAAAARAVAPAGSPVRRVFLVPGGGWADALSVSAVAARTGAPVLLTLRDGLPEATRRALATLRPAEVVVVGGTGVVGAGVASQVRAASSGTRVERWAGPDRFSTSVEVNRRAGLSAGPVVVATGLGYADALAAGAVAAGLDGSLLLTHGRETGGAQPVYDHIAARHRGSRTFIVGGPGAITPAVHNRVVQAVGGAAR